MKIGIIVHRGIDTDGGRIVAETNEYQSVLLLIKLEHNLHNHVERCMRCVPRS